MNSNKIAVLIDSCTDVPAALVKEYGMYLIPLKIIYNDREYFDGVDITPEEVYERFSIEIPKTSLPGGEIIQNVFNQIKADGYTKVIVVTISSGLSGTNNLITLISKQIEGLEIFILDTKDIAIGAGFHAIQAVDLINQGLSFEEITAKLVADLKKTRLYFVVSTLEYLQKGGRIGLISSMLGTALNLKPIISCNDEGIYYTVNKVRGRNQSLSKCLDLAVTFAEGHSSYNIAVSNGFAPEEAADIKTRILAQLPNCKLFVEGQISPALGVHTGPGTIGIAVQLLD